MTPMLQTLNQIKNLLAMWDLQPKHRLGQNFLHDHHHLRRIIDAAHITKEDVVLEVGTGTGALSQGLLEEGAELITIEIDRDLKPLLNQVLCTRYGNHVRLLFGDVLTTKHQICDSLTTQLPQNPKTFKLVANLPYSIASPLLANMATTFPNMSRAVVTVQREVANRFTAQAGHKDYGPLSILMSAMYQVEQISLISPTCFWPVPKVESAAVLLQRRNIPLTDEPTALSACAHRLFAMRRKQLGTIIGREIAQLAGLDPTIRPDHLTVEQLNKLAPLLS